MWPGSEIDVDGTSLFVRVTPGPPDAEPALLVHGLGGSAVLTDVVPSKTLIATSDLMTRVEEASALGVRFGTNDGHAIKRADIRAVNERLLGLAHQQSEDIRAGLDSIGRRLNVPAGFLDEMERTRKAAARAHRHINVRKIAVYRLGGVMPMAAVRSLTEVAS